MTISRVSAGGAKLAVVLAIVTAVLFMLASSVIAQSNTGSGGNSLKVSPLRTDVNLKPGESRNVQVYVENLETQPVTLKPIENDFVAGDDERGIPAIILDENEYAPTHSLKRFMAPLDPVAVQPGERKQVDVTINVPSDAAAGGYYGALRFAPLNPDGSENVNVSGSVASLILLTVPGNLTESLQLTDFSIMQDGKATGRLSSPDKVSIALRLENKGNVHVAPFGSVFVTKGGKQIYNGKVNDVKPAGVVLPDSARMYDVSIENLGNFGKYDFKLVLGYGSAGQTIDFEKAIWIIPTLYIILLIIALVVLILLTAGIVYGLKSYKRRILRGSRRRR